MPTKAQAEIARDTCDVDVVHLDAVRGARAALPDDIGMARVAELLSLLSSPTRLKMLLALQPTARGPRRELCVCDLATVTGVSKSLTSHQLRLLRAAGLVAVRRSGKLAYYRLADGPAVNLLRDALMLSLRQADLGTTLSGPRDRAPGRGVIADIAPARISIGGKRGGSDPLPRKADSETRRARVGH